MPRDALVVGINTYRNLSGLQAPARDAEAIANMLHTYGEFRVQRIPEVIQSGKPQVGKTTQVTLKQLETSLVNLFKPSGSNVPHTALFYFSGHGIQKEAGIREGFLAVSDSNPEVGFYGLSLFWLRRLLQESPVRQRIVILDCCHSGELLNFSEADPGASAGVDRLFMAASREYESAYESLDGSYSVLTQALLDGLDPHRGPADVVSSHALTAAVSHALKGELQQPLFENSGGDIILTRRTGAARPAAATTHEICPYRGLEFFDEDHADYFFGREDLTREMVATLQPGRMMTVVGSSGSGKSSIVRAGLIRQLRLGKQLPGSDRWRIRLLTPTEHPLRSLATSFIDPDSSELDRAEQLRRATSFLQQGGTGLAQLVRASLPTEASTNSGFVRERARFVLVIDQFEEVFTLCQGAQAERERLQFFDCLTTALNQAADCFSVVIVLRADFFGKCLRYETLTEHLKQHPVIVPPMSYEQVKSAILHPARKVGLECEPHLVYTMLLDVIGAPGELPMLQYTLMELWQRRQIDPTGGPAWLTLNAYTDLGGMRGTLQKRATEIFHSFTPDEQAAAKRIFLTLTQLGEGTEDTRRRALKSEFASPAFASDVMERTLEKLVAAKLIVTSQSGGYTTREDGTILEQETIDVAHETLIRNWSLLRHWLDSDRDILRRQRRIEQVAQEWLAAGKPMRTEYLLHGGRLVDADEFFRLYPQELSLLAQELIAASRQHRLRVQRERRVRQVALPTVLTAALVINLSQYWTAEKTRANQNYQLQVATSRERAAIAQSILQEPGQDSMTALLISRLAAEQGELTYEAQSSLRAALQNLRLQVQLEAHQGAVSQIVFSPDRRHLATAGDDGTIRLWLEDGQVIRTTGSKEPERTLHWEDSVRPGASASANANSIKLTALAFSPNGEKLAAIAQRSNQIKIWSVSSGELIQQLQLPQAVTQVAFSSDGEWIAAADARTLSIWQAATGQQQARLTQDWTIRNLQFSPDGRSLLVSGDNNTAQIWQIVSSPNQLADLQQIATLTHPAPINQAIFSTTGRWIATACVDGTTRLWNAKTGEIVKSISGHGLNPILRIALSANETMLAIQTRQQVQLWNLQSSQLKTELKLGKAIPTSIAFSPNSRMLVTTEASVGQSAEPPAASLWDTQTGQRIDTLRAESGSVTTAQFSLDGTYVATASTNGAVQLWAAEAGGELPTVTLPNAPVRWVSFVPGHARWSGNPTIPVAVNESSEAEVPPVDSLVTVASNGRLEQWEIVTDDPAPLAAYPVAEVSSNLHASRLNPQHLWDNLRQMFWHPETPAQPKHAESPTLQLSSNRLQAPNHQQTQQFKTYLSGVVASAAVNSELSSFALSPDSQFVATATRQGWVEIRQNQIDRPPVRLHRLQNQSIGADGKPQAAGKLTPVRQLVFSPDNHYLLGVSDDLTVRLWETQSGRLLHVFRGHQAAIQDAQFSPDGQQIVTASLDSTAIIWAANSGQRLVTLPHAAKVTSASFSPSGEWVVTTSWDGTARISDTKTGTPRMLLTGHQSPLTDAQFSPDGRSLVTASADGTARLWDAATGQEQAQLRPNPDRLSTIQHVSFSPDGQYIATLTGAGQVQLWAATWEMLLKLARNRSVRQLTPDECIRYLRLNSCPSLELGMHEG